MSLLKVEKKVTEDVVKLVKAASDFLHQGQDIQVSNGCGHFCLFNVCLPENLPVVFLGLFAINLLIVFVSLSASSSLSCLSVVYQTIFLENLEF